MDKSHLPNSPMVVCSLEVNIGLFHPKEENEKLLGLEVPYLNTINAIMFMQIVPVEHTFSINLLAKYNSVITRRY